jgi:glycosyltransferase involved in cell wall biosynthesis
MPGLAVDAVVLDPAWAREAEPLAPGSGGDESQPDGYEGVSVVIPAWNEELRLPGCLRQYLEFFESSGARFEIIVVADGVTDRTAEVAAEYNDRGVEVVRFESKLGKGGALIEGFRRARYNIVGFIDADAPVSEESIAGLLSELNEHEAAVASRWHPKSHHDGSRSVFRAVSSRVWNSLTHIILDLDLRDSQCGAKFFRREPLLQVLPRVTLTNWAFDACLLFHLSRAGYSISEVPVTWNDDPDTKLRVGRAAPAMLLSLIGIRLMSLRVVPPTTRTWAGWLYRAIG